ncbi:MAG: hypothetical protein OES27_06830 [Nitrosopumilus sp.]|nr:hypothetical protein [Nitrosopumilus sp.]
MKKFVIGIITVGAIIVGIVTFNFTAHEIEPTPPVIQQDLRLMIDDWMNNPEQDDRNQRLEIMKAYYAFEESR